MNSTGTTRIFNASLLALAALACPATVWACDSKPVAPASVQAPIEGKIVQAFTCNDAEGPQLYVESRAAAPSPSPSGKGSATAVSFYKFLLAPGGQATKRWQARDFIADTRPARASRHVKFVVRDVDGDGVSEAFISYSMPGQSASAEDGKLLVYYKDRKYAIRGAVAFGPGDFSSRTLDTTFSSLPQPVQSYALGLWDTVAMPRGLNTSAVTVTQAPEH